MKKVLGILVLVILAAAAPAAARVDFKPLPDSELLVPADFSADGTKMVATTLFGAPYFLWTAETGFVEIGGGCGAGQPSISPDGGTIVGCVADDQGIGEAAKWLGGMDWLPMGSEPGGVPCDFSLSSTWDNNGTTAVGLFWRAQVCRAIGGTWDLSSGTAGPALESTSADRPTRGNAITDDGSIVFGWQDDDFGRSAVKWVHGVQETIVDAAGARYGEVTGSNSDGSVFWGVGYRYDGTGRGWLHRNGEFLPMGLGGVSRNIQSYVSGASEDGSIAIGGSRDFFAGLEFGWIWTAKKGFSLLNDFLKGQGAAGWDLFAPSAVSRDGRFIAGYGLNPEGRLQAFLIDLRATGKPE